VEARQPLLFIRVQQTGIRFTLEDGGKFPREADETEIRQRLCRAELTTGTYALPDLVP
jgi:hypothetical protein